MAKLIGIDLFAGAGGMTLGAKCAGVDVQLAVEADPHAAATYAANHPEVKLHAEDIASFREVPIERGDAVTVLFGGPPCQGFSTSNQRTRSSQNAGNWLFKEFLRIATLWKPDWVVFENVKGITETDKGAFLYRILDELDTLGYTSCHGLLNATDFRVPQKRARLFVVANRHNIAFELPTPTTPGPIFLREALQDLPDLQNGASQDILPYKDTEPSAYARNLRGNLEQSSGHLVSRNAPYIVERYRHIRPGRNWEDIPSHMMDNYTDVSRCHTGIYHRLDPNAPSIVIGNYRKNMLIHPFQDRGLSVREAARIQSFPDCYRFQGSIGFQQQQVGNAVPPLLAQAVFEQLRLYSEQK